jgi:superfamily II DNA/RNA helicase
MTACGLQAAQLRADLTAAERDTLVQSFQEKEDEVQILIC